jgi:hypothetical protein
MSFSDKRREWADGVFSQPGWVPRLDRGEAAEAWISDSFLLGLWVLVPWHLPCLHSSLGWSKHLTFLRRRLGGPGMGIGPSSLGMGARWGVWLCLPSSSFVGSHVKEPPTQLLCLPVLFLPVLLSRVAVIQYHELVP